MPILKDIHNLAKIKRIKVYLVGGYLRDMMLDSIEDSMLSSKGVWGKIFPHDFGVTGILPKVKFRHRGRAPLKKSAKQIFLGIHKESLNLDFAIKKGAIDFAEYISRNMKGKFIMLDEKFGSARVILTKDSKRIELDFTDFKGRTIKEDLARRDFTINSVAVELENIEELIDPAGGLKDLKKRVIRTAYKDAFKEDPLRILRGFSIASRLRGFRICPNTKKLMKRSCCLLNTVSGERIMEELYKILITEGSFGYLKELDSLGALEAIFPRIKNMRATSQGGYHHLDVWRHSLETVRQIELFLKEQRISKKLKVCIDNYINEPIASARKRLWLIKLAAIFHDIGKPQAKYIDKDGFIWFTGHERIGANFIKEVSFRLKLSKKERDSLRSLILYHLRPGYLARESSPTRRAIFRFFRDAKGDAPGVLLLWIGDRLATRGEMSREWQIASHKRFVITLLKEYFLKPDGIVKTPVFLNGNEVMDILNIDEGPLVGQLLEKMQEASAEQIISTKDEAKEFIIKIYPSLTGFTNKIHSDRITDK